MQSGLKMKNSANKKKKSIFWEVDLQADPFFNN